jgi:hypothetical protein
LQICKFGRFNYYIADCRLLIVDWKNKNWIPAFAGMTREQDSEIICSGDPVWSPENDNRQIAIDN